jgi:hypothetical protein
MPEALETKLSAARRRWRAVQTIAGAAVSFAVLAGLILLSFYTDRMLALTTTGRAAWLVALLAGTALAALLFLARPLLRPIPDEAVAVQVERHFPALNERLLTTIELAHAGAAAGVSGPMVTQLARETERMSAPLDFVGAVSTSPARRPLALACVAGILLLGHIVFAPGAMSVWLNRILHPSADIPIYARTQVWVTPEDTILPRGENVTLGVKVGGRLTDRATLHYRFESGPWADIELTKPQDAPADPPAPKGAPTHVSPPYESHLSPPYEGGGGGDEFRRFPFKLDDLQQTVTYYATAGDGRSNPHTIRVEDRPTILSVKLHLRYPDYIGRRPETVVATAGNIVAPVGTEAEVAATANKPLQNATLVMDARPRGPWEVRGDTARGALSVRRDATYELRLRDTRGFDALTPPQYTIRAQPDQTPTIQITRPGADVERTPLGSIPLRVTAQDDYGIRSLNLVFRNGRHSGSFGLPWSPGSTSRSLGSAALWNLGRLNLKAGDTVVYEAQARDGDTVSGPHNGRSASYRIHIVGEREMRDRLDSQAQQELEGLRQLLHRQKEAQGQLAEARRSPQKTDLLRQAQATQRAIAQDATDLARKVEQTTGQLRENNIGAPSELQRREDTRQSLQQLGRQAMPAAAETIQRAERQAANRSAHLAEAARQEQAIRQELERLVRQAAPAPTTSELAQAAEQLAQEQQQLADQSALAAEQMGDKTPSQMTAQERAQMSAQAQQQAGLRERTQALQQDIQRAAADAQERGSPQAAALQQAGQQMRQAGVPQKQSAAEQNLQSARPSEAAPQQNEAARDLQNLADSLDRAGGQRDAQSLERRANQLEQMADRLSQMANRQQQVARETRQGPNAERSRQLAAQEQNLRAQAQQMSPQLQDVPRAQQELGKAGQSLQQAAAPLNRAEPQAAVSPAQDAYRQLLRAAVEAQEAARETRNQADAQAAEQTVRQLAREQRALKRETGQLEASRQGREMSQEQQQRANNLAQNQQKLAQRTENSVQDMPGESFRWALREAERKMNNAAQGLWQRNTGQDTQRQQENAAQTLERIAHALGRAAQSGQQGRQQNQQSGPTDQMAESQGDLQLAREMEAQIRQETGGLDRRRDRNPNRDLSAEQQRELSGLNEAQRQTRQIARNAAENLRAAPEIAQNVQRAAEEMQDVQDQLERQQTGRPTQEKQGQIVRRLDQAISQTRQAMRQQRQQMAMQQGQQQNQQQSPQRQRGNQPARRSAPVVQAQPGAFGNVALRGRGFGGLNPRAMQSLREGEQERVPAEYRDLVNQYYKALSERGR